MKYHTFIRIHFCFVIRGMGWHVLSRLIRFYLSPSKSTFNHQSFVSLRHLPSRENPVRVSSTCLHQQTNDWISWTNWRLTTSPRLPKLRLQRGQTWWTLIRKTVNPMIAVTTKSVTNPVIIIGFSSWNSSRRYRKSNSKTNNRTDDIALQFTVYTTPTVPFDDLADSRWHFSDMFGNISL